MFIKVKRFFLLSSIQLFIGLSISCKAENQILSETMIENTKLVSGNKIQIKIGEKTFKARLFDSPTTKAFKALLPLTINMNELNSNEKYADLTMSLPVNTSVPASIQVGDLMIYGSRTLVLFYKGFSTSYSYTKIGKIVDVTGLLAALGNGDVTVSFEFK
ncbi:COG4925 Uncharacterized conserved protein [Spirosomataceae bacterium]|jgi:hypothetical protein